MVTAVADGEALSRSRPATDSGDVRREGPGQTELGSFSARTRRVWMGRCFGALLGALLLGCEREPTVDEQLYIAELETQVAQLQADLDAAYQEVSRLSGNLTTQVTGLEGSMNDLNLRILDLPAAPDLPAAIREVEAAMVVAMQRVREVRGTTDTLAEYLQ